MKYKVLKDSQEKNGWLFSENDDCLGFEVQKLPTGDYTIEGLEDTVCIERKASTAEIAKNLLEDRFLRCVERMSHFEHKYLILEFSLSDLMRFPDGTKIPEHKKPKNISGAFLLKKLLTLQIKYNIHILFCDNKYNAWKCTCSIFKRIINGEASEI